MEDARRMLKHAKRALASPNSGKVVIYVPLWPNCVGAWLYVHSMHLHSTKLCVVCSAKVGVTFFTSGTLILRLPLILCHDNMSSCRRSDIF